MTQLNSVQMDSELAKYVAELEKRVRNLEDKFDSGKEVLTLRPSIWGSPGVHSTR